MYMNTAKAQSLIIEGNNGHVSRQHEVKKALDASLLPLTESLDGVLMALDEDDKTRGERANPDVLTKAITYYNHHRPMHDDVFFRRIVNGLTGKWVSDGSIYIEA